MKNGLSSSTHFVDGINHDLTIFCVANREIENFLTENFIDDYDLIYHFLHRVPGISVFLNIILSRLRSQGN